MHQPLTTTRRAALAAGLSLPWAAPPARAQQAPVNVVLESEVVILDPHATTAAITRTFATHVFDTLFAMDGQGAIRPQMVEAWERSSDGLLWDFRLRPGLRWHDGAAVTAADCVASLERWAPRDSLGRMLWAAKAGLQATDSRAFRLALSRPFPMVLEVLGKPNAPLPAMLPERLARVPVEQRIREPVGSGPFRFRAADWRPGSVMVLERFEGYAPREEPADFLAGGPGVELRPRHRADAGRVRWDGRPRRAAAARGGDPGRGGAARAERDVGPVTIPAGIRERLRDVPRAAYPMFWEARV